MKSIVVSAAILYERGGVLVSRRKAGQHLAGSWEFPGGKVEPGEDPRDALVRELREELGITCTVGEIVDCTFHRYDDADKAVLLLFFEATRTSDSPEAQPLDVAEVAYFGMGDLTDDRFPPADVPLLRKIRERLSRT
jgi:8-oxo-dGTP diphosphatase